jgi:hypothetical protein
VKTAVEVSAPAPDAMITASGTWHRRGRVIRGEGDFSFWQYGGAWAAACNPSYYLSEQNQPDSGHRLERKARRCCKVCFPASEGCP